jgi:hypothetical protein
MNKLDFVLVAAVGLLTSGQAWADKVSISVGSVASQCGTTRGGGEKQGCVRDCGDTLCHYHCEQGSDGKNQEGTCTVNIYISRPVKSHVSAASKQVH